MRKTSEKSLLTLITASEVNDTPIPVPLATTGDASLHDESILSALRAAVKTAAKAVGGKGALAHTLGLNRQAIYQWQKIPAERIVEIERLTGVRREVLRPDLYQHPSLVEALETVKAAGYRVSKPRPPKHLNRKDRVGPTFVAEFADGTVTRMSTFTSLENLDWGRGERLSQAAYQSRWRTRHLKQTGKACLVDAVAPVPPAIISARFEQDGKVLAYKNGENAP